MTVTKRADLGRQLKSMLRFGFMAVVGFSINFGLTVAFHEWVGLQEELAFAIGLVTVYFFNFFVFRYYVFEASVGSGRQQFWRFLGTSIGFRGGEYVAFLGVHSLGGIDYRVAVIGILGVSMVAKFLFYPVFVFRQVRRSE